MQVFLKINFKNGFSPRKFCITIIYNISENEAGKRICRPITVKPLTIKLSAMSYIVHCIDPGGRGSNLQISFPSGKDSGEYPRDEVKWIIS